MIPLPLCLGFHGRFWLTFKVVRRLKQEKKKSRLCSRIMKVK